MIRFYWNILATSTVSTLYTADAKDSRRLTQEDSSAWKVQSWAAQKSNEWMLQAQQFEWKEIFKRATFLSILAL